MNHKKSLQYYTNKAGKAPKYIFIILLCVIFLMPFIVMFTTAFKTLDDAFRLPVSIFPREFTLENFPAAMNRIPFWSYMGNTAFITLISLAGQLIVTPMVAYSLAKIKWKEKQPPKEIEPTEMVKK